MTEDAEPPQIPSAAGRRLSSLRSRRQQAGYAVPPQIGHATFRALSRMRSERIDKFSNQSEDGDDADVYGHHHHLQSAPGAPAGAATSSRSSMRKTATNNIQIRWRLLQATSVEPVPILMLLPSRRVIDVFHLLKHILWPHGWQAISLTNLITGAAVKKQYRKVTLCIHPDKVQQKGTPLQQKYIAEKVFDILKEAWNKFNSEELS